jgi:S1-C subfamily serine protease
VPDKGTMTVLLTNKHVVKGATRATIYMSRQDNDGRPIFGNFNRWHLPDFHQSIVEHPDPAVDLVAFPIGAALMQMQQAGTIPFFRAFQLNDIPSQEQVQSLTAIEDVLMIGYPTGIWDEKNNLPIVRRGITATPYAVDYNGRAEFVIDAACFPGSSGSPIVIANQGSYAMNDGGISLGSRLHLLGLLWGGPQFTAEGRIIVKPVPTSAMPVSLSQIPTNLGYCIKARMIRDLEPILLKRFG